MQLNLSDILKIAVIGNNLGNCSVRWFRNILFRVHALICIYINLYVTEPITCQTTKFITERCMYNGLLYPVGKDPLYLNQSNYDFVTCLPKIGINHEEFT